jgi:uncharacterized DUF497 family protein
MSFNGYLAQRLRIKLGARDWQQTRWRIWGICCATILYIQMVFAWDAGKDRVNRWKHGVSFETAARVFEDPHAVSYPDRVVDEEERWHTIGQAGGIALLLVVHTSEEEHGEEKIRIISARKASSRERSLYDSYQ